MAGPSLLDRLKSSRLVQVLILYLGASWIVIEVAGELQDALSLPDWVSPVAVILLLIGLVVVLATAWVQSHPRRTSGIPAGADRAAPDRRIGHLCTERRGPVGSACAPSLIDTRVDGPAPLPGER